MVSFSATSSSLVVVLANVILVVVTLCCSFGIANGQLLTNILKSQVPIQTFFIPLIEQDLVDKALKIVNNEAVSGNFVTILAFAVTTDNTVIWYDHWEEGYEIDVTKPQQPATQIWGDGNAFNGCPPDVKPCTDSADRLMAGETIQILNEIPVSPRGSMIRFDGSDMVHASYPITVTRTGYSVRPGSVLAGGIEVYDTDVWGTKYEIPLGQNMGHEAFQLTSCHVMAKEPTVIIFDGNTNRPFFLDKGEPFVFNVTRQGMTIESTKPVQVAMITGDVNSVYEMRWFSLQALDMWASDYMSPVGDTQGKSKMVLYNPNPTKDIIVKLEFLDPTISKTDILSTTITVPKKGSNYTRWIPLGSGARVTSIDGVSPFNCLSFTDTEQKAGDGYGTGGNMYDWGFPVVPVNMLTPQVVIGLGFGCTGNACPKEEEARSPVWISPMEDAFVYIDYTNSGNASKYDIRKLYKYESIRVRANNTNKDMSGALIFATKWDGSDTQLPDPNGTSVDIASAWGQDPNVSTPNQGISMDLGTVVVPFTIIRVSKYVNAASAIPGSKLMYTIRIMNVGQTNLLPNSFQIFDPVLDSSSYVPGSTRYSYDGGITSVTVPDSTMGTAFPLDEGLYNMFPIARRGGAHEVTFEVIVEPLLINTTSIVNTGYIQQEKRSKLPFQVSTPLLFLPSVTIVNTLYLGQDNGVSCDRSVDKLSGNFGNDVTYCFVVTNDGNTFLKVDIDNALLSYNYSHPKLLKPGESFTVAVPKSIGGNLTNIAIATGTPVFFDGTIIPFQPNVNSQDPSTVDVTIPNAKVQITNTVLRGMSPGISQSCVHGGEKVITDNEGSDVTYCLKVKNTGNTYLDKVTVTDPAINYTKVRDSSIYSNGKGGSSGLLAPGASFTMAVPRQLMKSLSNTAYVTGVPVLVDRTPIVTQPQVSSQDDSKVIGVTVRSGTKDPIKFKDPGSNGTVTKCMLEHWHDQNKKSKLTCTAKEVYLENIKNMVNGRCTEGKPISVDISADVIFRTTRYDPAFFVATDGGDAMTGTCSLHGFESDSKYLVVDPDNNKTIVGKVMYDQDFRGGNDKCGDVIMTSGGSGMIKRTIINNQNIVCTDNDNDGSLDISICFSWRVPGTDDYCTLTSNDPKTTGSLADVFPGTPSKCFCYRYNIPQISVDKPIDPVDVCI